MFRLVLVLGFIAAAQGNRIIGGQDAKIEDYKHQAVLRYRTYHTCGCSIVAPSVVVLSSRCVNYYTSFPDAFTVKAGSENRIKGGQIRNVQKIHQHPKYDMKKYDYDVAILILTNPFNLSDKLGVVKLVEKNLDIEVGTPSWVTGWGLTSDEHVFSTILQVAEVYKVDKDVCADLLAVYKVTERMCCWGYSEGVRDSCQGDDGGPVVIDGGDGQNVLAGIVLWRHKCAQTGKLSIYTDVTNEEIHDFITSYILM